VATWGGFVFLHLTPGEAVPLADELGPVPTRLRRYPLEDLAVGRRLTYRVAANWKLVAENYNECYHCAGVHPELCRVVPAFKRGGAGLDWERGIPTARVPGPSPPPARATGRRSLAWTTTSAPATRASWSTPT
jgi:Rieske 2Fe-2S family protein